MSIFLADLILINAKILDDGNSLSEEEEGEEEVAIDMWIEE